MVNQKFWTSKTFWTSLATVVVSVGVLFTGEVSVQGAIPNIVLAVFGVLNIVFRWTSPTQPLGFKK